MLHGYDDVAICDFFEFEFPLGYFGDVQRWSPDSYSIVKTMEEQRNFLYKFKGI